MARDGDLNNLLTGGLNANGWAAAIAIVVPIWFVATFWWVILKTLLIIGLIVAGFATMAYIAHLYDKWEAIRDNRRAKAAHRVADIIYRAESQNARLMDGDESALYGLYPPADL